MKRGNIILTILEEIRKNTIEDVPTYQNYGGTGVFDKALTPRQIKFKRSQAFREEQKFKEELRCIDKRKRQKEVYRLIKEGFINKTNDKINLTKKGEEKRLKLRELFFKRLPFNKKYQKIKEKETIIVSFDIPEKQRDIRNWIREILKFLNYQMIHQSVWYGNAKLPEDFFQYLHKLNADKYIKIFTVGHRGNLKVIQHKK